MDSTISACDRLGGTGGDAGEIVVVLGTDAEAEQSTTGSADQLDLFSAVAGGETCRLARPRSPIR